MYVMKIWNDENHLNLLEWTISGQSKCICVIIV